MSFKKIVSTDSASTTLLIKLMAGIVFVSATIQKLLFPGTRGFGRFEKIGLPDPAFLGPGVAAVEILCGVLVLIGLTTRLAFIPLIIIMLMAIATTKTEVLVNDGFWEMMHDSRTDWAMLPWKYFSFDQRWRALVGG